MVVVTHRFFLISIKNIYASMIELFITFSFYRYLGIILSANYTGSKNVSGFSGLNISLHVITVTKFSVSLKLIILCVQPGII